MKKHGDMSGHYVLPTDSHDPQQEFDGIASVDCDARRVTLLIGYFPFGSIPAQTPDAPQTPKGPVRNLTIALGQLLGRSSCITRPADRRVRLLYEYIPSSGFDAMAAPTVLRNELAEIPASGPMLLEVGMAPLSAMAVTLSSL